MDNHPQGEHRKSRKKLTHWLLDVATMLIVFGSLLISYLYFIDGANPITFSSDTMPVVQALPDSAGAYLPKKTFYTGEQLTYLVKYCKYRNVPVEIYGAYVDTVRISMPVVKLKSPVGCGEGVNDLYKIPKILPTGKYHFEVELIYQVNPLRQVRVTYRTEDFEIINQ